MAEAKATKKEFLGFMSEREIITARDLMNEFDYSYSYACKRLSLLKKQGLVQDMGDTPSTYRGQWCLTEKGHERLYFLQQREKEWEAVIEKEKMLESEKVIRLKKRVEELYRGKVRDLDRQSCLQIIDKLIGWGAEGIVLGCTELPLLIRLGDVRVLVFDTTRLHAEAAVELVLSE